MTPLELLQAGKIAEFNARRGTRMAVDLFAADLANLSLVGADLSRANLEKADLSGSDLTGVNLAAANLAGSDLSNATLDRIVAVKAKFREAYLGEARAQEAELTGADFTEADLTGLYAPKARLVNARLREAILTNAQLPACDLTEARLGEANLQGAEFTGSTFVQADLSKANCTGARFERVDFTSARLGGATLRACQLAHAKFTGADLTGADLTGAILDGATFEGADTFEAILDPGVLTAGKPAAAPTPAEIDTWFEEPTVAISASEAAVLWENADGEDVLTLRIMLCPLGGEAKGTSLALPIPSDQVTARALVPLGDGTFLVVLFAEKPGGTEVVPFLVRGGELTPWKPVRLGYTPVVRPVLTVESGAVHLYGIGRQGALSVHILGDGALTEKSRVPAGTWRGFCGRLDPVLLGKGGTVTALSSAGTGRLLTAPTGYPGRLTAAALRRQDLQVALAWTMREERGVRFAVVGQEPVRLDPKAEVAAVDVAAVGERWLLTWTREADTTVPMAAWMPEGAPFVLVRPDVMEEIEEMTIVAGGADPHVALSGGGGELLVVRVGAAGSSVVARFG